MYNYNSSNKIDCAIIVVDSVRKSGTYDKDGSALNYGYHYTVKVEDIEKTMKYISVLFNSLGLPCSRIYLSGFACLTESSVWSKERITEHALSEANKMKSYAYKNAKIAIK